MPQIPRRSYFWLIFFGCIAAVVASYGMFRHKAAVRHPLDCTPLVSVDGTKELEVYDDGTVVLWDDAVKDDHGHLLAVDGKWKFDESTKLYAVTLNNTVTIYRLVEPKIGPCMLVKGDLSNADIRASWFSKYGSD